jgi:hypothetical protein
MRFTLGGIGLLACAALGGCWYTYATVTPINGSPRPMTPRPVESVEIFSSGPPTRAHKDVSVLVARGNEGDDTRIAKLREEAAANGCDAVVLGNTSDTYVGHGRSEGQFSATCIVYTDGEGLAQPVAVASTGAATPSPSNVCQPSADMKGASKCPAGLICDDGQCVPDNDPRRPR